MKNSVCCCGRKRSQMNIGTRSNCTKRNYKKVFSAFTLAEMMVVMLIMSIILAAMAPVMTTRSKADTSSPWRYSPNNSSDAYFGTGNAQIAMIGQPNKLETDDSARLIINSSDVLKPQIAFKRNNTNVGRLYLDANNNVILGNSTLDKLTSGVNNISIGPGNLTENTSGQSNIAIGDGTLKSNTTGTSNTALGTSLGANTTGSDNTALGDDSLVSNKTGSNNVAVGVDALTAATDASWNIAIGKNAYQKGTSGSNTIIGGDAMSQGTGTNNVAIGTNASFYGTGNGNVSIGANSNYKTATLTTFTNSTAIGFSAYGAGANSVALGYGANATNNDSIAIGDQVSSTGESAIAIGSYASTNGTTTASGSAAIAIGDGAKSTNSNTIALGTIANASSASAVSIGGYSSVTASYSTALGNYSRATSSFVTALGYNAVANGYESTAVGANSSSPSTASVAIGYNAAAKSQDAVAIGGSVTASGESAIAIGSAADVQNTTASGSRAIAIGDGAVSSGEHGVALGRKAKALGGKNIAIGDSACEYVTGSNKICIGAHSGPSSSSIWSSDSEERIFIGGTPTMKNNGGYSGGVAPLEIHNDSSRGTAVVINGTLLVRGHIAFSSPLIRDPRLTIISNKKAGSDDTFNVGGWLNATQPYTSTGNPGYLTNSWIISDRQLKYVGKEFTSGLDKIRQLKVFNYTFKKDKNKTPHVGVIAQDLQKIFPNAVKKGADGFLTIRMEDMFYAMINAIKELDLKYQAQEKRINDLEKRIEKLEARVK